MSVEERLIDSLVNDEAWGHSDLVDPVARITLAWRRRRRRRAAAGLTAAAAVAALVTVGVGHLRIGDEAIVRPAGPAGGLPSPSDTAAVAAQRRAAAQASAAQQQAAVAAADARYARNGCPTGARPVTAGMADGAYQAVVAYNEQRDKAFRPATLRRDRVTIASSDPGRGAEVTAACGPAAAQRTLVVYTTRTDLLPSASLSEGVYFVSRVSGQLSVWEQAH